MEVFEKVHSKSVIYFKHQSPLSLRLARAAFFLFLIILLFISPVFGQSDSLEEAGLKENLEFENSKGFAHFIYGTSINEYEHFDLVQQINNYQEYKLRIPFIYNNIHVDSVILSFYKSKLFAIKLYIDKSQNENFIAEIEKLYGAGSVQNRNNVYFVQGVNKTLSLRSFGYNNQYLAYFRNLAVEMEIMQENYSFIKAGKGKLDAMNGLGPFTFGASTKKYFDFVLEKQEGNFSDYKSSKGFNFEKVFVDSAKLEFHNDQLFAISFFVDKKERELMDAYFEKEIGPKSPIWSDERSFEWKGEKVEISIFGGGNGIYTVRVENVENEYPREREKFNMWIENEK